MAFSIQLSGAGSAFGTTVFEIGQDFDEVSVENVRVRLE
jgi:hypothetical protein